MSQITNQNQAIAQLIKQQNRKRFVNRIVKRSKSGMVGVSIIIIAAVLIYLSLIQGSKEVERHDLAIAAQVQLESLNAQHNGSLYNNAKGDR